MSYVWTDLKRLEADNERLHEALKRYGRHGEGCDSRFGVQDSRCDCGFDAALASAEEADG